MIDLLTAITAVTALGAGALLALRVVLAAEAARRRETFRLAFPRSVEPGQLVAALRSIQGLLPRFPDRLVVTRTVTLEASADASGVVHCLGVPREAADLVLGQLAAAIPGLRAVPVEREADSRPDLARELHATGTGSLRTETTPESNAALLATLQPLDPDEAIDVQWAIGPTELVPAWLLRLRNVFGGESQTAATESAEPILRAVCRIGVSGPRPGGLLARVLGASHRADTDERRLRRRALPSAWVGGRIARAAAPVLTSPALAADELAAVLGVPVGGPQLPGLRYAGSRPLPPAPEVRERGRILGDAIATGAPVALDEENSRRGLMVTSPTGSGKSTVLERLCASDFAAGHGIVCIETKGDLCHALADLAGERARDVVVFDPADEMPAGFNLLSAGDAAADLIVDHVVGQFRKLYAGYLGPRSEMLLRAALLLLSQAPGNWTICEAMPVLTFPALRRRLLAQVDDEQLAAIWAWFDGQSEAAQAEMVGPLGNKLAAFTLRRKLRAVVGQGTSALDFDAILRERKIALIALRKALIGEDAAALLGSCVLAELWAAIQRRAALPAQERRFVSVVLDEAQDFLRLPGIAAGDAAAQSRALGCGWTTSFQNLSQIDPSLRATLLANLRSKLVMQTSADDARAFAREFAPHLDAADLQGLGPFEAYAAVSTGAAVAPPTLIRTRPPLPPLGTGEAVRARSRERYGKRPEDVDAEIKARLDIGQSAAPVGTRRRR